VLGRILTDAHERLLAEERDALARLQLALARFDVTPTDETALRQSIRQLDELFLLVIVGEFNAGKSAFINALLGRRVLEEGVTPTTTRVHLLAYGPEGSEATPEGGIERILAPVELLRDIHIVDTPGTNAIYREHEAITAEFVPRADLVLFVTSADRPFTETERGFMQVIREWGKKIVVVINKVDILETPAEVEQVERFVKRSAATLLGFEPDVFPVSARAAFRAKTSGEAPGGGAGRFGDLVR
jgi:small GTP-binding protein